MLNKSILNIKGIGPKRAGVLKNECSIETIEDLLYYIPRRYIDRSTFKLIKDCFINESVTVAGRITGKRITGRRKRYLEIVIDDGTDTLTGIFFGGIQFFHQSHTIIYD